MDLAQRMNSMNIVERRMAESTVSDDRVNQKQYDYLLKFLLVGDSDVGKQEILSGLDDVVSESLFTGGVGKYIYVIVEYNTFICVLLRYITFDLGEDFIVHI